MNENDLLAARTRARRLVLLFVAGYVALVGAWVMSSRPFAAPDEQAHYLRALTIANGQALGPRAPNALLGTERQISVEGRAWQGRNSRAVSVPAALSPPGALCLDGRRDAHGSCAESTYTGNYQPLPYLLPALALRASSHAEPASWLARGASALGSLVFLALAIFVLWDGALWSVLGLAVATTPMVLFTSSVISPSGLQITAAAAFLASLLRLARGADAAPRWIWAASALSGAATVLSWQLGPAFALLDLALFGLLIGRRRLGGMWRSARGRASIVVGVLVCAVVLYGVFALAAGETSTAFGLTYPGDLHSGLNALPIVLRQAVGVFGLLTVNLPAPVTAAWYVLAGLLVLGSLLVGERRTRVAVLAACAVAVLFPTLFEALAYIHTGFGLQGRYVLPVLVMVPLVAGEALRARRLPVGYATAGFAVVAGLQLIAWWVNARSASGRSGAVGLFGHATWTPPLGWWPWLVLALAGAGLLMLSALHAAVAPGSRAGVDLARAANTGEVLSFAPAGRE